MPHSQSEYQRWYRYLALVCLSTCLVAVDGISAEPRQKSSIERVSFTPGDFILVPVKLQGQEQVFFANPASLQTVADLSVKDQLGKPLKKESAGEPGVPQFETFTFPELKIGRNRPDDFRAEKLACVDLFPGSIGDDRRSAGSLGMDYLQTKVLRLDFDQKIIELKSSTSANNRTQEKLQLIRGIPSVLLHHAEGGYQGFQITFGDFNLCLNQQVFNRLVEKKHLHETPTADLKGVVRVRSGILDCLELGPYRLCNQHVTLAPANLIGQRFLSHFNSEFDFPNRVAYFEPSEKISAPTRYNHAGFGVFIRSGRRMIVFYDSKGAGVRAGLQEGDEIVRMNGTPANELTLQQMVEPLTVAGGKVELGVKRDSAIKTVKFQLSNEPDPFPNLPYEVGSDETPEFDR